MNEAEQLWKTYCNTCNIDVNTPHEAWPFGGSGDELADLVLAGDKRATTSLYELYEFENEKIPCVGDYSIILDGSDHAVCIIRDIDVEIMPFCCVDEEYAFTEGEGDKSLDYWRREHEKFFSQELMEETGREFKPDAKVVCETFEVVFRRS